MNCCTFSETSCSIAFEISKGGSQRSENQSVVRDFSEPWCKMIPVGSFGGTPKNLALSVWVVRWWNISISCRSTREACGSRRDPGGYVPNCAEVRPRSLWTVLEGTIQDSETVCRPPSFSVQCSLVWVSCVVFMLLCVRMCWRSLFSRFRILYVFGLSTVCSLCFPSSCLLLC